VLLERPLGRKLSSDVAVIPHDLVDAHKRVREDGRAASPAGTPCEWSTVTGFDRALNGIEIRGCMLKPSSSFSTARSSHSETLAAQSAASAG
jgi:hypothetical protein